MESAGRSGQRLTWSRADTVFTGCLLLVVAALAVVAILSSARLAAATEMVEGEITSVRRKEQKSVQYCPTLRWAAVEGRTFEEELQPCSSDAEEFRVGEKLTLRVDPNQPGEPLVAAHATMHAVFPWALASLFGLALLRMLRKLRRVRRADPLGPAGER